MVLPTVNISRAILTNTHRNIIARELKDVLQTHGFTYIAGHGINPQLIKNSFKLSKEFFVSCTALHSKFRRRPGGLLGYVDGANEKDDIERPDDLKQAYDFVPYSSELMEMPTNTATVFKNLFLSLQNVSNQIQRLLVTGLGNDVANYFEKGHQKIGDISKNSSSLRILHYPLVTGKTEEGQNRITEHTDFGSFTMLLQDQVGGLEILTKEGLYEAIPYRENTIVLNVGDILSSMARDQLKATMHRVVVPENKTCARQSIAYFTNPDNAFVLPEFSRRGRLVNKSTVKEYIDWKNNSTIFTDEI